MRMCRAASSLSVRASRPCGPRTSSRTRVRAALCGLEELDRVPGGGVEQDLLAARAGDDVVAKAQAGRAQSRDVGREVLDDEMNAVPATGPGRAAVRHWAPGGARPAAQQQSEPPTHDIG